MSELSSRTPEAAASRQQGYATCSNERRLDNRMLGGSAEIGDNSIGNKMICLLNSQ